ncbi:MAG TPA: T9SS type A sorting domain-containing protein [Chitinophagaceae bacterium]|nr:T9SS type A sorting domain-containing protein [Chitinophagaceae bacterium]
MKKILLFFLFVISITCKCFSQSSTGTLDVVSWNIEWFGSPSNGPANDDLQESNVKTILSWLNADLYGLVEIVDSMRLRRVVDFLGNSEFGFAISPYCSGNTTGTGNGWLTGQKLAFIYRKSVFTNISIRGIMRNSPTGYTNWAAGRFPYMFSATTTINGISKNMNFIVIHGKAGSTQDDYLKRTGACVELKDTLDTFFSTDNNFIIGDYNDALHTSIYPGASVSSYTAIVTDSIDADHYKSLTLPLGAAGQTSMINFPNVIDNHIISNEVEQYYITGSAQIKTDVTTVVPDYVSAHNTSDHYPVFSKYNLASVVTGVPNITANELGIKVYPNPFEQSVSITATKTLSNVQVRMLNQQGQMVCEQTYGLITAGSTVHPALPPTSTGMFFMQLETKQYKTTVKLLRL